MWTNFYNLFSPPYPATLLKGPDKILSNPDQIWSGFRFPGAPIRSGSKWLGIPDNKPMTPFRIKSDPDSGSQGHLSDLDKNDSEFRIENQWPHSGSNLIGFRIPGSPIRSILKWLGLLGIKPMTPFKYILIRKSILFWIKLTFSIFSKGNKFNVDVPHTAGMIKARNLVRIQL